MSAEERVTAAFYRACDAPPCLSLSASLVEFQRTAETKGLTETEMEYWSDRLDELTQAALSPI